MKTPQRTSTGAPARLVAVVALTIVAITLTANGAGLTGNVKDASGRPLNGAKVRVEAKTGGNAANDVQTDSRGHYAYDGLTPGVTYRVTLLVNGAVKASINNVLAKNDNTTLNFDLKKTAVAAGAAAPAKKKHYVWVPATTGTNIGGRWVEVDDGGNADTTSANNVETAGRDLVRRMQSNVAGSQGKASGGN